MKKLIKQLKFDLSELKRLNKKLRKSYYGTFYDYYLGEIYIIIEINKIYIEDLNNEDFKTFSQEDQDLFLSLPNLNSKVIEAIKSLLEKEV